MVEWLAGNRLRGTTAERPNLGLPSGSVGGWVEVGRTTLGSAGDTIDVSSLPDKRYYMVLGHSLPTGQARMQFRLNSDSGSNYAYRASVDGGSDTTAGSAVRIINGYGSTSLPQFSVAYLSNLSSKEKLFMSHTVSQGTAGAGTAPNRQENVDKWANTSSVISSIQGSNDLSGDFNTNSEVVVLGWDPADTHTTNFWEELASVELTSAGEVISSGTITAKKYLWVQGFVKTTSQMSVEAQFNNDTGNNYSRRRSDNGGAESIQTNVTSGVLEPNTTNNVFFSFFVVNNSSNEKLGLGHNIGQNTAGAGTAPKRTETAFKWTNTSSQITEIDMVTYLGTNPFLSGSTLKVWGSD